MLDYIKAEIYRTRKTANNKIMWILGVAAILISMISLLILPGDYTRDNLYFGIGQMMYSMSVFMSILIMGAGFKESFEEKNYVQKGFERTNIIFGDLIVASISTIIKAIAFTILVYVASLFLKESDDPARFIKEFISSVFIVILMVLTMNSGVYAIYNITGKSGVASTLSFFMYLLIPQISQAFMNYDNIFGKIAKFIFDVSPIRLYGQLHSSLFNSGKILEIKNFIIMIGINFIIFNIISVVAKKRKRY